MNSIKIDLVKYRWIWFGIFASCFNFQVLIGIFMCCLKFHAPLKPGIDFTGGSILQYQFDKPVDLAPVREALNETGFASSQVQLAQIAGSEVVIIRTKAIENESEKQKLDEALRNKLGNFKMTFG